MNAREVFEREWALYRDGNASLGGFGDSAAKRKPGDFDAPVKAGEIRVFADMARPFVALVVEDCGMPGWRIVPVSPFTVPASPREMLVGERVLQLWNACIAARSFVARSWRVDEVAAEDLEDVVERLGKTAAGRVTAGEGAAAEYERMFLVSGGNFEPIAEIKQAKRQVGIWRRYGGWSLAAMLMICFGATWMVYQEELKSREALRIGNIRRVKAGEEEMAMKEARCEAEMCILPEDVKMVEEVDREVVRMAREMRLEKMRKAEQMRREVVCCAGMDKPKCEGAKVAMSPVSMSCMSGSRNPGSLGCMTRGAPPPWPVAQGTERYAEIQENGWRDPRSEPLSTFGLDVDTSSYTTMRRYLTEMKRLPPKDSVRLEEYVNYFKFRYPQPKDDDPVAVACEMGVCPWAPSHKLLRVGVQAKEVSVEKLPPCNLTFLVDVSGSMGGNGGFEMMKAGLKMLIEKLRPEDHVAIVTYASGTEVRLASTPGSEKEKIRSVVDSLRCGGCTYGAGGIQLAYEEAKRNFDKKANNRVILVTDGDFNVGISTPKALEEFIAEKRESGIFLTVLGVGCGNYQDANMKKLSTAGNGNYAYLDSVLEAKKVMMTEFGGTLFTVAKDVKLQLEFNPAEVKGYRLLGYESRKLAARDFNDDKKDAGEIGSGHAMTAFYEIIPVGSDEKVGDVDPLKYQKRTESGHGEVCTVKLRWKKPDGDTSKLKEIPLAEAQIASKTPSEDFRFASAVAEFALLLSDSEFKGGASFDAVIERARSAKGADAEGYRAEFIRLVEAAQLLPREQ